MSATVDMLLTSSQERTERESNRSSVELVLVRAVLDGDRDGFARLYDLYAPLVHGILLARVPRAEVDDLVQDIFLRLWRERDTLRIENLNYYLFSAVRYEVIDYIRTKGRTFEYLDDYGPFEGMQDLDTENQLALDELLRVIDECLHILPEKTREIFRLHKLEYWPIARIATRFGLSEKAVEYHLTKSVRIVRTHLKEVMVLLLAASGLI